MRTTRALSERDRFREAWITLPGGPVILTPARYGNRFRVRLTENAILEPPHEGAPGQKILWRFQQDGTGGRTVTPNASGFVTRGDWPSAGVITTANAVSFLEALYDDEAKLWDIRGLPGLSTVYQTALTQGAAVAAPVGGATVDAECRAQLSALLVQLRLRGTIAT